MSGTLVALGTSKLSFARLLRRVEELAARAELPHPVAAQAGHTPHSAAHITMFDFVAPDVFEGMVRDAELVITQAGGGTVLLARLWGKLPVAVPRLKRHAEVIDDHQVENAKGLEAQGLCVACYDLEELPHAVARALDAQREGLPGVEHGQLLDRIERDLAALAGLATP